MSDPSDEHLGTVCAELTALLIERCAGDVARMRARFPILTDLLDAHVAAALECDDPAR